MVILSSKKRRGKVQFPNVKGWRQKSWELGREDAKRSKAYYTKYETYVKPKSNRVFGRYKSTRKFNKRVSHLCNFSLI